jgi:DNA-binding SARP family transcriptional activator
LLDALWPDSDPALAGDALYSRVRALQKLLSPAIGGLTPVLQEDGRYWLNGAAGVGVDVACFDELTTIGDRQARAGLAPEAIITYRRALAFYHGDLCIEAGPHAIVERERLRARYLTLLATLGTHAYDIADDETCLAYAQRMLVLDPCREDAHRLVMRCHVRQGERAQALHQFRVCEDILRSVFNTSPEPETAALFEQVRCNPGSM